MAPVTFPGASVTTFLSAAITLLLTGPLFAADTLYGRVVSITDGDTIQVLDNRSQLHKVRLAGIDAPEKQQDFADVATKQLSALIFGRTVKVEWKKMDRYRRIVGTVYYGIVDINLEMIRKGLAWHFKAYEREQSPEIRALYAGQEEAAKRARIGLWSHSNPVPPWDFRKLR